MAKKISELPKGAKETLRTIAASMVSSGAIDSVAKIKKLDEIFETDMEFLSSLLQ
jgi:phosphoglucomutase